MDEAPRRAVYHTNRAAAYLEQVWEMQAAAEAASLGANADTAAGSSSSSRGGVSSSRGAWREVGGALDGLMLDGSPESIARQLQAALMDCRAAVDLVPGHAKGHYR